MIKFEVSSLPNLLIFQVKASAYCLVSRHSVSVTPKTWGVRDTLKCELGQKEVQTPDVVLLCGSRVYQQIKGMYAQEPRVTYVSDKSGDLFLRDACLGKPKVCAKRSFTPSNVDPRSKGSSGQGMKGGHTEAHETTTREVHLLGFIDGHPLIQKYKNTSGKWSKEYYFLT